MKWLIVKIVLFDEMVLSRLVFVGWLANLRVERCSTTLLLANIILWFIQQMFGVSEVG